MAVMKLTAGDLRYVLPFDSDSNNQTYMYMYDGGGNNDFFGPNFAFVQTGRLRTA